MTDVANHTVLRDLQPVGGTRHRQPFICTRPRSTRSARLLHAVTSCRIHPCHPRRARPLSWPRLALRACASLAPSSLACAMPLAVPYRCAPLTYTRPRPFPRVSAHLHAFRPVPTRPGPFRRTAALTDALWSLPTLHGLRPCHRHAPRAPAMRLARPSRAPAPATTSRTRRGPLRHVPARPFSTCRRHPSSSPVPAAPTRLPSLSSVRACAAQPGRRLHTSKV